MDALREAHDLLRELPGVVELCVEHPRGSFVKRRADGRIDVIAPLPSPYDYGFIPGRAGGDGDPLDAILYGPSHRAGARVRAPVLGVVAFEDQGALDLKVVCGEGGMTMARQSGLYLFFNAYAPFKRALALARGRRGRTAFSGVAVASRSRV